MKSIRDMIAEQSGFCGGLRRIAQLFAEDIDSKFDVTSILLTGSAARGDARMGKFGILVDLTIISDTGKLNLQDVYGPDMEPFIPYYCTRFLDTGFQIKEETLSHIFDTNKPEPECFALSESVVLTTKYPEMDSIIRQLFPKKQGSRRDTAMVNYRRYFYLCGEYRYEKWEYREAYPQMAQNFHEAFECFCGFVYAVNGSFIPRKDWLAYLLPEQEIRPDRIDSLIPELMDVPPNKDSIEKKKRVYQTVGEWMKATAENFGWL
ncbi:MAG: hypothetical protein HPY53_14235 [Brevinematales bacterium]|nr:hypothetical protein [Brevinematales bacterium]